MKKAQVVCNSKESHDWISQLASCQNGTCVKHVGGPEGSQQLEHYKKKLSIWPGS